MRPQLSDEQKAILLTTARESVNNAAENCPPQKIELDKFPLEIRDIASSFVTLTKNGILPGCIGSLEASQPLIIDVQNRAYAAATQDYRFNPVTSDELDEILIEVSILTPAQRFLYTNPDELIENITPHLHGVVLKSGTRRATFLPQVWEKIPEKEIFMERLCLKMGLNPEFWRQEEMEVYLYEVEEFHE